MTLKRPSGKHTKNICSPQALLFYKLKRVKSPNSFFQIVKISFLSQIQETAKAVPFKKVSINVADLFNELNEQYTISSSVPIEFKKVQGTIKADHLNLKRALINIINNAVNSIESNSASITVDFKEKEGKAHFFIKDNGPGIEPSLQDDLFGPFTQFKKTQGVGIGCSISYDIIKRHEGHIELKSKKGETVVKVTIPQ